MNDKTKERLQSIETFKNRQETMVAESKAKLATIKERIQDILAVANKCVECDIQIDEFCDVSHVASNNGHGGCGFHCKSGDTPLKFVTDVFFPKWKKNVSDLEQESQKFVGIGYEKNFIKISTDGTDIFKMIGDVEYEIEYPEQYNGFADYFLGCFDEFETRFYEYVDKTVKG